jgi:hypothetical protein
MSDTNMEWRGKKLFIFRSYEEMHMLVKKTVSNKAF